MCNLHAKTRTDQCSAPWEWSRVIGEKNKPADVEAWRLSSNTPTESDFSLESPCFQVGTVTVISCTVVSQIHPLNPVRYLWGPAKRISLLGFTLWFSSLSSFVFWLSDFRNYMFPYPLDEIKSSVKFKQYWLQGSSSLGHSGQAAK